MNFNFLIVDKLSNVAVNHRRSVIMWFCYHFFMVALCCVNILFFILNWSDLTLCVNDITNILLTIIGFLFAFAGINIYSIFNTNIEAEKERLIEIREQYSQTMNDTLEEMNFSADITKLQLYGQLIFTSQKSNSQLLDWMQKTSDIIKEIKNSLEHFKKQKSLEQYMQRKNDVIAVSRSIGYLAKVFYSEISKTNTSYFYNVDKGNAEFIKNKINALMGKLDELGGYTVEGRMYSTKSVCRNRLCDMIEKLKTKLGIN